MLTMEEATARVKAGIAFLDEQAPWYGELRNWRHEVAPEYLEMDHAQEDVLGQIFGDYDEARRKLKLSRERSVELGFSLPAESDWDCPGDYVILGAAWITQLRAGKCCTD